MLQFEIDFQRVDPKGRTLLGGPGLELLGPVLPVVVAVPPQFVNVLLEEKKSVPQPSSGVALIDTGATRTSIDQSVIESLGLPPVGKTTLGTASGPRDATMHAVQISFPAMGNLGCLLPQAIACDLAGQEIPGQGRLMVLFGRDLLKRFVMIYNGPLGRVSLIA